MTTLRVVAILIALGAVVDPAISLSRAIPAPVRVHVDRSDPDAADAEARLRAAAKDRLEFVGHGDAEAHVVIGGTRPGDLAFSKPVSFVTMQDEPGTGIVGAPSAVHVPVNGNANIAVAIRARGLAGQSSVVVLEDGPVELARTEHRWSGDETATIQLPYLALTTGARRVTVRVEPAKGERRLFDNRVDVLAMAEPREGRIAVIEPRPSWPAGFVRRELESDPAFRVASILRTSSDVSTRAGDASTRRDSRPAVAVRRRDRRRTRATARRGSRRAPPIRGASRRHGCVVARPTAFGRLRRTVAWNNSRTALDGGPGPRTRRHSGERNRFGVVGGGCPAAGVAQRRACDLFLAARRRPGAVLGRIGRVALPR